MKSYTKYNKTSKNVQKRIQTKYKDKGYTKDNKYSYIAIINLQLKTL